MRFVVFHDYEKVGDGLLVCRVECAWHKEVRESMKEIDR